jgi:hypothetical protein
MLRRTRCFLAFAVISSPALAAADYAEDGGQIDLLRLLDVDHRHAAYLKIHDIPLDSPFIGNWGSGDDMLNVTLRKDGSGLLASLFAASIAWKMDGNAIDLEMHPIGANRPDIVMTATGTLSPDGKTLGLHINQARSVKAGTTSWGD